MIDCMQNKPINIDDILERILPRVTKPARYVGGELNEIRKSWDDDLIKIALAFPDVYEIGMANSAIMLLYSILNAKPNMLAERVFLPWTDMQEQMKAFDIPLYTLENKKALKDFDIIGVTLPYEIIYTNFLSMLELGGIPLRSSDRGENDPIVIAGGHAMFNPEPVWAFVDAVVVGEGEDAIVEIATDIKKAKAEKQPRKEVLERLSLIKGIYVPSLYSVSYDEKNRVSLVEPLSEKAPQTITKRIVSQLDRPITSFVVPHMETVHDRVTVEIMRGCTRGCRFCHAGIVTRPVRERKVEEIVDAVAEALEKTGYSEVGLLSLSSSDYRDVMPLVDAMQKRFAGENISISLPSLRIESLSIELMEKLSASRRGGFTLAPEAASEKMRKLINKPVESENVIQTAAQIYQRGWTTIKLYFMIGHPHETLEDVEEIANLCHAVIAEGRRAIGGRAKLNISVGTFVPKSHTPFQWAACDLPDQIRAKQNLLRSRLKAKAFKLSWSSIEETKLEARLARGDRRLADVIEYAYRQGARFDAWREHFSPKIWEDAFREQGIDPDFYSARLRDEDEVFPWDHIDAAVDKAYLRGEYEKAIELSLTEDCREDCHHCGLLKRFRPEWKESGEAWYCPKPKR